MTHDTYEAEHLREAADLSYREVKEIAERIAGRIRRPADVDALGWELMLERLNFRSGAVISTLLPDEINDEIGRAIGAEADARHARAEAEALACRGGEIGCEGGVAGSRTPEAWIEQLAALGCKPEQRGRSQWVACCPAHDDAAPSLSVGIGRSGHVIAHCFAGCSFAQVSEALWP
jgi:hypothetical protein